MKTYFIFLCLVISSILANASIQTTASQDKPPRLYVKSYTENDTLHTVWIETENSGTSSENDYTINDNINWADGSPGNYSGTVHADYRDNGEFSGTADDNVTISWGQTWWPNIPPATWKEIFNWNLSPHYGFTNTWTNSFGPTLEHCDVGAPIEDNSCILLWNSGINSGTFELIKGSESRTAQAMIKLQTGGKSTSRLRNLFQLTASITRHDTQYLKNTLDYAYYYGFYVGPSSEMWNLAGCFGGYGNTTSVPPQSVCIGSYGNLNANGTKYLTLPDNADVDVTPNVSGVDYYTFNLGTPQKYHSYFDLYVQQANPGYSLIFYSLTNDVGHAFWRFRTDAPADALQYISANLAEFLGNKWGFYPNNTTNFFTAPGILQNDNSHSYNVARSFYIGFPDLLQGLIFTSGISAAPPVYSLSGYNCVSAAREAGFRADVFGLPWDTSPQNFGVTLIEMYPAPGQIIGPFIDTTDIFYSAAPY